MASFTLQETLWPVGTTVAAYPTAQVVSGAPTGSPVDSSVVQPNGAVTFDGLNEGATYWAFGSGDSEQFIARSVDDRLEALEAGGGGGGGGGGTSPDASATVKGVNRLSVDPSSPTFPVAVGDNDTRVPTQGENDALQGTQGTPAATNRFVTDQDPRNTNARTPTSHTHVAADLTPGTPGPGKYFDGNTGWTTLPAGGGGGGSGIPGDVPVLAQTAQPTGLTARTLWIPTDIIGVPVSPDRWQLFVPDPTPGIPLSALYHWFSTTLINPLTDGTAVPSVPDRSGNGRDLAQSVVAKQPTWQNNVQNSLPVLRFTNSAQQGLSKTVLNQPQPFEIFMVFRVRTDANASKTSLLYANGGSIGWSNAAGGGARGTEMNWGTNWYFGANTTAPLTWNVWHAVINSAATATQLFRSSTDSSQGAGIDSGSNALTQITVGFIAGATADIDYGELIVTNRILTAGERTAVHTYLKTLWGTA